MPPPWWWWLGPPPVAPGALTGEYFVDHLNGNDNADGLTPETAWQTIDPKVNSQQWGAGARIRLCRGTGQLYREQLLCPTSGNGSNQITLSYYGTGAMPRITSTNDVTGSPGDWTNDAGADRWYLSRAQQTCVCLFDGQLGDYKTDKTGLVNNGDWTWSDVEDRLYVWSPAGTNPTVTYNLIEAGTRTACIDLDGQSYWTIEGVHLYGGQNLGGISQSPQGGVYGLQVNGIIVQDCVIRACHGSGIRLVGSGLTVRRNDISDISLYPAGGIWWGDGILIAGVWAGADSDTITLDGNTLSGSIERQGIAVTGADGVTITGTIFEDLDVGSRWGIDLEPDANHTVTNVVVEDTTGTITSGKGIQASNAMGGVGSITNITLRDNVLTVPGGTTIQVVQFDGVTGTNLITGNTLQGGGAGIRFLDSSQGTISENTITTITGNQAPVYIEDGSSATVQDNYLYAYSYGLWARGSGTTVDAKRNRIQSIADTNVFGIYVSESAQLIGQYNVVIGFDVSLCAFSGTPQLTIYNSTCYGFELGGLYAYHGTVTMRNCIFYSAAGDGQNMVSISDGVTATIDPNAYWCVDDSPNYDGRYRWKLDGWQETFENWQNVSGQDANSMISDPIFRDASKGNLVPAPVSRIWDAGTDLGGNYAEGLDPDSSWPDAVLLRNQDDYGPWDLGAYVGLVGSCRVLTVQSAMGGSQSTQVYIGDAQGLQIHVGGELVTQVEAR